MMVTTCTCQKWKVSQNVTGQTADERSFSSTLVSAMKAGSGSEKALSYVYLVLHRCLVNVNYV